MCSKVSTHSSTLLHATSLISLVLFLTFWICKSYSKQLRLGDFISKIGQSLPHPRSITSNIRLQLHLLGNYAHQHAHKRNKQSSLRLPSKLDTDGNDWRISSAFYLSASANGRDLTLDVSVSSRLPLHALSTREDHRQTHSGKAWPSWTIALSIWGHTGLCVTHILNTSASSSSSVLVSISGRLMIGSKCGSVEGATSSCLCGQSSSNYGSNTRNYHQETFFTCSAAISQRIGVIDADIAPTDGRWRLSRWIMRMRTV